MRTERYDSDALPVLLRLPDVHGARTQPPDAWRSEHGEKNPADAPTSNTASPAQAGGCGPAGLSATGDRAPSPRTPRMERRRSIADDGASWLPGVRRFLFAVLMAAALLAVIVTLEQWNRPAPKRSAPPLPEQSTAAVPDPGLPELAPAANATWTPPGTAEDTVRQAVRENAAVVPASVTVSDTTRAVPIGAAPSGLGWADAGEAPAAAATISAGTVSGTPLAPHAAGYADGVDGGAVPFDYPSTGRGPVLPELPAPSPRPWPSPAGQPAAHSADRNLPGPSYPTR